MRVQYIYVYFRCSGLSSFQILFVEILLCLYGSLSLQVLQSNESVNRNSHHKELYPILSEYSYIFPVFVAIFAAEVELDSRTKFVLYSEVLMIEEGESNHKTITSGRRAGSGKSRIAGTR